MQDGEKTRRCVMCRNLFPETEEYFYLFFNKKRGRSYFMSKCRTCQAKYLRDRHAANREHDNELSRIRRKAYYEIHREIECEKTKKYKLEHIEKAREWKRNRQQTRRARLNNLAQTFTQRDWEEVKREFDNSCAYCGKTGKLTQEHFVPVNAGGDYTKSNIIPACVSCNCSKNRTPFEEWYERQPFYNTERKEHILRYVEKQKEKANEFV